ncbi:hypothetical protein H6G00_33150 [Leptolyngbya sp. FACHB-541]|uniref:hypothetical protein n=1 Tax=Leptolyngbya sp. FACHB-541 TaxID=2692810 RepID=UPI0016843676|nr:hypothetical protein [Leptolyngbya sp. FACHB-541]MBD2001389.1 hypothetical protein [Leptolyngbya sp. FACHB-541]
MEFMFPPAIQEGIRQGIYKQVFLDNGTPIGMARNLEGRFVSHAIGTLVRQKPLFEAVLGDLGTLAGSPSNPLSPLIGGIQMFQVHRGFQKTYQKLDTIQLGLQSLQNSVSVLQTATALIGIGTVAGVVLSAINLHQTLKLREDVKQLRIEIKDGFLDLKQALKGVEAEILQRIDQVAQDVEFRHHRTIIARAYGRFTTALIYLRDALKANDVSLRNSGINNAQKMLFDALADYDAPHLLEGTCPAGQLRRQECVWAINQAITKTYELQGEYGIVGDRISELQEKICQDSLYIVNKCGSEDELDFLFPEITRIHSHDMAMLQSWKNHAAWIQELSPAEKELLANADLTDSETDADIAQSNITTVEPQEQLFYESLKSKSHFLALRDQLKLIVRPTLRLTYEDFVSQQAQKTNYKALAPSTWKGVPDLAVANLYWYFKNNEEGATT